MATERPLNSSSTENHLLDTIRSLAIDKGISADVLAARLGGFLSGAEKLPTPDGKECEPLFTEEGYAVYPISVVSFAIEFSASRIMDLLKDGRVRGVKPARDWLVSFADVLHHIETARPGRPRRSGLSIEDLSRIIETS